MPEMGCDAKGFQDSAVQSAAAPLGPDGAVEEEQDETPGAKAGSPPAEGDEPDRVAIVELTTELETQLEMMPPAGKSVSPYPDFPETNPFRLAAKEVPVTPVAGQAPVSPAGPAVRRRETGDGWQSGSLAQRRGSPSELKVTMPPFVAAGAGSTLLAQRAVSRTCEPELVAGGGGGGGDRRQGPMERRDSIWDRLPPLDTLEQRRHSDQESGSGAGRLLRSPFPLVQPAPTPDQTNDEGRELFLEFVHDRIVEEGIPEGELALDVQHDDTMNRIMSLPGLSNPVWAQTGTELRALADAFATSHQRQELRCKAQQTDLTVISWDRFRQLLEELFSGEAGVTQERILVLFFFLSDCVVSTIRRHAWSHLRRLIEWSLRYIVERVCTLVQEAGGWGVVLRQSAEYLYLGLKIAAAGLVCVAAIVYIRKG